MQKQIPPPTELFCQLREKHVDEYQLYCEFNRNFQLGPGFSANFRSFQPNHVKHIVEELNIQCRMIDHETYHHLPDRIIILSHPAAMNESQLSQITTKYNIAYHIMDDWSFSPSETHLLLIEIPHKIQSLFIKQVAKQTKFNPVEYLQYS